MATHPQVTHWILFHAQGAACPHTCRRPDPGAMLLPLLQNPKQQPCGLLSPRGAPPTRAGDTRAPVGGPTRGDALALAPGPKAGSPAACIRRGARLLQKPDATRTPVGGPTPGRCSCPCSRAQSRQPCGLLSPRGAPPTRAWRYPHNLWEARPRGDAFALAPGPRAGSPAACIRRGARLLQEPAIPA